MLLPELYALPRPNFFKFHVPTSGLAHALSVHLLPLSGTHCLAPFVSVNLWQRFGNTSKLFISNLHFLVPPSDPVPQRLQFNFWYLCFINAFTYLLIYCSRVTWSHNPVCNIPLTCESTSYDSVTPLCKHRYIYGPSGPFSSSNTNTCIPICIVP